MSRPNISKPTTIRPPFVPRTIINPRVVDSTIIAKLFLICQEGQISNIKDYILKNGLTANDLVNTDGQSILHVILLNDSITPREKTDIFKFLASRNLLKFSYDSQQKTPLHIASEKQLTEIVKILINASHDVNALDSTRRTPIYYAITGTEVECPKKQTPLIEQKKTVKIGLQDELNQEIVKFINDNLEIKDLLQHLYNTTKTLDSIYYDEITKILEDDNKKIMEILVTEKDEERKKEKIFEKVYETRNSIINMFVKEKFTSTLKPISFNKVDANTWGPDENPINKFLNDVEPSVILKEFELDFDKQKMIVQSNLENNIAKNLKDMNEIKEKNLQGIEDAIYDLNFYSILYDILKKYSNQTLLGGFYNNDKNKQKSIQKSIKKSIKKYIQSGGANPAEITAVITFMTANIPGLSAENEIMTVLPLVIGNMIDSDPKFSARFTRAIRAIPVNVNFLGQIYANVIENNDTLINNNFIHQELNRDVNILNNFIRHSNDTKAEKIAETIFNAYQTNNALLNPLIPLVAGALETKPLVLTYLVGFNNGQLFLTLRNNLIHVINNHNDLFEDINFIKAINNTLRTFTTLISGSGQLRATINLALTNIVRLDPSFLFNTNLITEYQKNNDLFNRFVINLIPQLIIRPLVSDLRLIKLFQNDKELFEKILEKFTTVNLTNLPLGLTPQNISDLTSLFVSSLIHYDLRDTANAQLNIKFLALDPQLLAPIQAILNNPALVTNIKNAYTPHPTIALITGRFANFQPDDEIKRALTQILNNMPALGVNVANVDELAKLFSDAINLNRAIILNGTFINFISTQQTLLLKIVELQVANDINIYTLFEQTINVPGSRIGQINPSRDYLIQNYKIVINLIDRRRDITVNLLVNLIQQILQSPNVDTFVNDIITNPLNITFIKNNKSLMAELVKIARNDLLIPIAKLLCVIDDNHTNNQLITNLTQNLVLLAELCSIELRNDVPTPPMITNQNIVQILEHIVRIPRTNISSNKSVIDKIINNPDLAIEVLSSNDIPVDMISKIIIPLLDDYNKLTVLLKTRLKNNLQNNINALAEIIENVKNTSTKDLLSTFLFDYFTIYTNVQIQLISPSFVSNKDLIYRLIDNDNKKNPPNADPIRKNLALLIVNCMIQDKTLLNDKNIQKLLSDEKSIINEIIDIFSVLPIGTLTNDEIAEFVKYYIIKNNAVSSDSLRRLQPDIMIKIISSDYNTNTEYNMISQAILAVVERVETYFNPVFDPLIRTIVDKHLPLIKLLADRTSTDTDNKRQFVATLLINLFRFRPDLQDEKIKTILVNNTDLLKQINDFLSRLRTPPTPPTPVIVGRLTVNNLKELCKYDGDITFVDRRINDETSYDLNVLRDDMMQVPSKPKVKINEEFLTDYAQLIEDHQVDFIPFNGGTNFIRKIKIIHTKIRTIYDEIETIFGIIKIELTKSLQNIDLKVLFENIIRINVEIISIVNYLTLFYSEFNLVKVKINTIISNLKEEVKILKTENKSILIPSKNKKIEFSTFYEALLKIFEKLDSTSKLDIVQDLYKNCIELQESLNKSINFINLISATKYIIAFNNGLTDFNTIITSGAANPITNIFDRNIKQFSKLYPKFETILSEQTQDLRLNKLNFVNKFVPQFNQYNFFSYYQQAGVNPTTLPRIGFMVPQNYLNRTTLNGEPKLTYGINGNPGEIENADQTDNNNLLQYKMGIKNGYPANRIIEAFKSVNLLLDKHFLIIKNFLIRKLIKELYEILQTKNRGGTTVGKESLEILLQKTYAEIKDKLNLPQDNLHLFLIMLTQNIDKILTVNITNFILNGVTRFGFRENRHQELKTILDRLARIRDAASTDDNFIHIIHTSLEQLTKPDDIVAIIKANPNAYRLEYDEPIVTEKNTTVKRLKPYGLNDITNDRCLKTDIELINLLIQARASTTFLINNAIESNNPDVVKLLIDSSSVSNEKSRNSSGQRPLDLIISQIKYFGSAINSKLVDNLIEESLAEISTKTSTTMQMRYHDIFYRLFYILFNHLLLDLTNQMKYENKKKLRRKLQFTKDAFPLKDLINFRTLIKREENDNYVKDDKNIINKVIEVEIKQNEDKIKMQKDIEDKIKDLLKELNDVEDKPSEIRKQIINDEIRELQSKLLSLSRLDTTKKDLDDLDKDKIELRKTNNKYLNKIIIEEMKKLEKKKNFMDMYKSLDEKVFGGDIKTVNNILSSIFKKENLDKIDIIKSLSKYIETEKTFDDYVEIKDYLNRITQFASDYTELDQELHSQNYALEKIYEIISYVIKHTISINLLNIIQQLLRNELTRITPQQTMSIEDYSRLIDEKIKAIIKSSKINEYINSTLIDKIITITFNLTTDKTDIQSHFDYITKILSLNGIIPITMDSEIVKTLSNNIYPYFVVYTEINLKKIKTLISGLFNLFSNLDSAFNIYKMISDKAKTEQ